MKKLVLKNQFFLFNKGVRHGATLRDPQSVEGSIPSTPIKKKEVIIMIQEKNPYCKKDVILNQCFFCDNRKMNNEMCMHYRSFFLACGENIDLKCSSCCRKVKVDCNLSRYFYLI